MGVTAPAPPQVRLPPPASHAPTLGSAQVQTAEQAMKDRAKAAEGMGENNTVMTSPQGAPAPATAKTLLGQ